MNIENKFLVLCVILTMLSSCTGNNLVSTLANPVLATQTFAPPTQTKQPTQTPTPKILSGLVENAKESEYIYMGKTTHFPLSSPGSNNSLYSEMYISNKQTPEGMVIKTPKGSLLIGKSTVDLNTVTFSFYLDSIKVANITVSKGALIEFYSDRTNNGNHTDLLIWGYYDALNSTFVFPTMLGLTSTSPMGSPINLTDIDIDENWVPKLTDDFLVVGNQRFCISEEVGDWGSGKTVEEIVDSELWKLTYMLPNNEIYRWGPPPLPCPYIEITYP